ncbi:MAG TPA: wax ester/triacylglycerol synthase family O-acyltransferase [Thermoanaerobaculia bacterium]|nr:wax ester/triacylglycerol synthase family O-acyltransferase [Thermoanaerobaculia bacterium]
MRRPYGVDLPVMFPEPLSAVDRAWLRMDDPTNLMMITGVLAFEQPMDRATLERVLRARLLPIPRFRQRVVGSYGRGRLLWEEDPDFELARHVEEITLPGAGGDVELKELVSGLMSRPLPADRPLWCFHLIHGYQGGSAVMARLHHVIGDGIALMLVLLSLTDPAPGIDHGEREGGNPFTSLFIKGREAIATVRRQAEELMPEGMKLLLQPADLLKTVNPLLKGIASLGAAGRMTFRSADPQTLFKGALGVPKRATWSQAISVEEVRETARRVHANLNDVLLSSMAGSLGRYLRGRGVRSAGVSVRAALPVNLRPLESMADLGNQFGLVFLPLPLGILDPLERLAELRRRLRSLKTSAEPLAAFQILRFLGVSPLAIQRLIVRILATKATAVATSVPGPKEPLYLAGNRLSTMFFWVPQAGRVGLGISILSYAGEVRMGVASDAGLVPDPDVIVEGFYQELEDLRRRAP